MARYLLSFATLTLLVCIGSAPTDACCPAPPRGIPVVNADQSVIIVWDAEKKIQHFIRRASFKSDADDFGFLIPSPKEPKLDESGNEAFASLAKLTEPEIIKAPRPAAGGGGCGCGLATTKFAAPGAALDRSVNVLQEKVVAGFRAVVLETNSTTALVAWLKDNGYAFSPEIEAWAKPYVDAGWKITALKVAKDKDDKDKKSVTASALRMSFKTDRPLFPYREPDYKNTTESLGAKNRLLRIFFVAEARYEGELTKETPWTGKVAWAGKVKEADRTKLLEQLKLPETTGPADWWLTEFEDNWPYKVAPADVYFARSATQDTVKRLPIVQYVSAPIPMDAAIYALAAVMIVPPVWSRLRRRLARN